MAHAPRLPEFRGGQTARGGRITSSALNSFARDPVERTISLAAKDALLRIVYGRTNIPGHLFAQGLIGTDLVLGYVLCIGEIDAVEMVQINDVDASTIAGVTVTTYLGTPTQGVDPTLASAVLLYNDTVRFDVGNGLRGVAYVVLRITTSANVGGWPRMRATIRGRKVFDPRTGLTVYSDNTALCTADLISDLDYGLGLTATNVADVADWNDSLLADGETKRSRIALVLENPRPILPDWLDLLSSYGGFYWIHEGADIKLVRDSVVTLSTTPIEREWIAGTLSVRHEDTADAPRSVEVIYTAPRDDALPWATDTVLRELAGGAITPTTLRMEGIFSQAEADNKALAKLNRMQSRVAISCEIPDRGITYQVGDVIRLDSPARGITELPMRVLSMEMSAAGRYRISGEQYDPSHYPDEAISGPPPETFGTVPDGAIAMLTGASVPGGWAAWTNANGRYLMGTGGAHVVGATGGTDTTGPWSGVTNPAGSHSANADMRVMKNQPNTETFTNAKHGAHISGDVDADHTHDWSMSAQTLDFFRRDVPLAKNSGGADLIPASVRVFGLAGLEHPDIVRVTSGNDRLVRAADAVADSGPENNSQQVTVFTTTNTMPHDHIVDNSYFKQDFAPFEDARAYSTETQFNHSHQLVRTLQSKPKRRRLAVYGGTTDYPVIGGMIMLHEGAVPAEWVICDGGSGTPDMRDYLAAIAGNGQEGQEAGDNTVTSSGSTGIHVHNHDGGDATDGPIVSDQGHKGNVAHGHGVPSQSQNLTPPFYAINFIMFVGGQ